MEFLPGANFMNFLCSSANRKAEMVSFPSKGFGNHLGVGFARR
jgi:hypothetical protein